MGRGLTMSQTILELYKLGWVERKIARDLQLTRVF